jgi:FtsP/CotA-like multicopper oxidase with cupredoxin domain
MAEMWDAVACDVPGKTPRKIWNYEVVALSVPIIFNKYGDHDPNGMIFALARHRETIQERAKKWRDIIGRCGHEHGHSGHDHKDDPNEGHDPACHYKCHHCDGEGHHDHHKDGVIIHPDFQPDPLIQPLVIRARQGDCVKITLTNHIRCRNVGMHLIGPGYGACDDGSHVGENESSLAGPPSDDQTPGETVEYTWECPEEGVFFFHDIGDPDGDEDGSNAHGLFGALVVEPPDAWWTDPAKDLDAIVDEGLYVDVHQRPREVLDDFANKPVFAGLPGSRRPPRYSEPEASFREYVLFFFDEPEVRELKCRQCCGKCHQDHDCGHHGGHHEGPCFEGLPCPCKPHEHCENDHEPAEHDPEAFPGGSLMLFNYRSEPMKNRERQIWHRLKHGELETTVINEEQHHSSWMFGDGATPILKAYLGDPVRIRLIHAGVKETHVFHLHLYSWHDDYRNPQSPLIDAVTITPGTAHTFVPLYGAGNIHAAPGDVIWHCHLYPHFHMGMWGIFRTFDTLQEGKPNGDYLDSSDDVYEGRRIGEYPDGSWIEKLAVLPDRGAPPQPTPTRPGFPLFIAGRYKQKSVVPPWPYPRKKIPETFDYRPATDLELKAMNSAPKPGELFDYFPHPDERTLWVDNELVTRHGIPSRNNLGGRGVVAAHGRIDFNPHGWHDPDGHFFYLAGTEQVPKSHPKPKEPLFFRANAGDVLDLTFTNGIGFRTPEGPECAPDHSPIPRPEEGQLYRMDFDYNIPPCDAILVKGEERPRAECGLHVHIVKFDPIAADGASTGWNYMSAPRDGMQMKYRWWADEDFGVIFFHDHLFANTRQRHGLFGAMLVEPEDARYLDPWSHRPMLVGSQAVIRLPDGEQFREFCIGLGDWVAMYDGKGGCWPLRADDHGCPIQGPAHPSSHDDNGSMAVNYRSAPLRERGHHPERWFQTRQPEHKEDWGVTVFHTLPNEPIVIRLIQGSHEEQHSFQIHDMRWRRFRGDLRSPMRNQQTLGISEAFTFEILESYGPGDYLWRFSGQEDTWLGCWGLIRAYAPDEGRVERFGRPRPIRVPPLNVEHQLPEPRERRRFRVDAVQTSITYRDENGKRCRPILIDPKGLAFIAHEMAAPGSDVFEKLACEPDEPLILRCYRGEYVEIEVRNRLDDHIEAEKHPPQLPVERDRNHPPISSHVSMHADLVSYDVRTSDGVTAGKNPPQTIPPGGKRTYLFKADIEPGPVLLQDMSDIRNHRHHGLFGTLVVEPPNVIPYEVAKDAPTANIGKASIAWTGSRATLFNWSSGEKTEEIVLLLHDGIRYYVDGEENEGKWPNPRDAEDEHGDVDTEDQGHKAFNYRSERLDRAFCERPKCNEHPKDDDDCPCHHHGCPTYAHCHLHDDNHEKCVPHGHPPFPEPRNGQLEWFTRTHGKFVPATPIFVVPAESSVMVRFVGANDKPRNHGFTIHGHAWPRWTHRQGIGLELVSSEAGITTGTSRTYVFEANKKPGDYLYRATVLKWTVAQGPWGILRVV